MSRNRWWIAVLVAAVVAVGFGAGTAEGASVAWKEHKLNWNQDSVLGEGDVVSQRPVYDFGALPIGNGTVTGMVWNYKPLPEPFYDYSLETIFPQSNDAGAAAWNRGGPPLGVAMQVTRTDARDETPSLMRTAGRVFLPDLGPLMNAKSFVTKLQPAYGWVVTQSNGVYADARVQWDQDAIVMRLRGLPPGSTQRVQLDLPAGKRVAGESKAEEEARAANERNPSASTSGSEAIALWEAFASEGSSSGVTGTALVAHTSNTTAVAAPDSRHATITGTADSKGALDVWIAVPRLTSLSANPYTAAAPIFSALGTDPEVQASIHQYWWGEYWAKSHMRVYQEPASAPAVASASASSAAGGDPATAAIDANPRTKWTATGAGPQWLELDLAAATEISGLSAAANPTEAPGQTSADAFEIDAATVQIPDGSGGWKTIKTVTGNAHWDLRTDFTPVTTSKVRIRIDSALNPTTPQIAELELYAPDGSLAFKRNTSQDSARYMEGLWTFSQYLGAISQDGAEWPLNGLQGPFSFRADDSDWGTWMWHYNTRWPQAPLYAADHGSEANAYESFYLRNLAKFKAQATSSYGIAGACVGEVLNTGGNSVASCLPYEENPHPDSMVLSSGAEVALDMYRHYRTTLDPALLDLNGTSGAYEFMKQVAIFYREYAKSIGGVRHVYPANSQEAYLGVCDTIPDLAAMHALLPLVAKLARERTVPDTALAESLEAVVAAMPAWPTSPAHGTVLLPSRLPDCSDGVPTQHNVGQISELDLVYPFGVAGVGLNAALTEAAQRTFRYRKWPIFYDFAPEPVWAARLGMREDVRRTLEWGTAKLQTHPSGFSNTFGNWEHGAVYSEWPGIVGTALNEMALQSPNETIDVAAGWPTDWGGSFQLLAPGAMLVSAQISHGKPLFVGVKSRKGQPLRIISPWPGSEWRIVEETSSGDVTRWSGTAWGTEIPTTTGATYRIEPTAAPVSSYPYAQIVGTPAAAARTWCPVRAGFEANFQLNPDYTLAPSCPQ